MGKPQEQEEPRVTKVRRSSRIETRDRYLDEDRRDICREAYADFLEMLREAVEGMK